MTISILLLKQAMDRFMVSGKNRKKSGKVDFSKKITVGLLIDYARPLTAGGYQSILWDGIAEAVKSRNANLLCFAGRALREPYAYEAQRNVIYDLVDTKNVDGLILCGGLGNFVTPQEYRKFCERFLPLPIVSIALPVKNIPTIAIDNTKGLRNAFIHLIEDHGFRKIAFIRGYKGNQEAEQRYQIYKEVLNDYDIVLDPNLVTTGDFLPSTGEKAVWQLFHQRRLKPGIDVEALVAANDAMALGALDALKKYNISVPEQLALVGFDDIFESRLVVPSLTTVRQPLREQGKRAVDLLFKLLAGEENPKSKKLSTEFVLRQSCGCLSRTISEVGSEIQKQIAAGSNKKDSPASNQKAIIARLQKAVNELSMPLSESAVKSLLDSFFTDVNQKTENQFIVMFGRLLCKTSWDDNSAGKWHDLITCFHNAVYPGINQDREKADQADIILQQARIYVGEISWQKQAGKELRSEQQSDLLGQINERLSTAFHLPILLNILEQDLPQFNIIRCYLILYEPDNVIPSRQSRLIFGYDENGRLSVPAGGQRFQSRELVPRECISDERRFSMLLQPLFFHEDHLGFILFETGHQPKSIFEVLRRNISTALKGALLFEEREEARRDLSRSNIELEQYANVVSHDLNEPLRTVSSYLKHLENHFKGELDAEAGHFLRSAVNGTVRMKRLINDLLDYSKVRAYAKPFIPVDCDALLKNLLIDLKVTLDESKARIAFDHLPTIIADYSQIRIVFQNLIDNAIKFRSEKSLKINISVQYMKDGSREKGLYWQFSIRDNGIGIEEEYFDHIFEVFRRLHNQQNYSGTGIGLAICKKIIERHGGRIWLTSEPGEGSTFYFTIPDRVDVVETQESY